MLHKLPTRLKKNKILLSGFTLVELLVVIGIIGILAAAILATINPIEQLKRAQDTSMKSLAAEYVSANVRYFSTHNALPWHSVANGGANCYTGGAAPSAVALSSLATCTTRLVTEGELKQSFTNSSNLSKVVITNPSPLTNNTSDVVACFLPQSAAQQRDVNTRYTTTGAAGTSCKSQGGTNNCYWCAQ